MPIPDQINALIGQLNQELDMVSQEANIGIALARTILDRFPDNAIVIELFAYLNSALFLVELDQRQLETIINSLSERETVTISEMRESGEILANELGRIIEARITVERIRNRLENLL
jgi:hypothetical protein